MNFNFFKIIILIFTSVSYAIIEKPFVIIIPSYNNIKWYKENLDSVLNQEYKNYKIIYIDDNSSDGTGSAVEKYLFKHKKRHLIKLIKNKNRRKAFANLYDAIHSCDPNSIIVTVDGDDFLKHEYVLKYLNHIYSVDIWMTYGQFSYFKSKTIGYCKEYSKEVIKNNSFRKELFQATHLRTFYAWLFQNIKLEDLLFNDNFLPMAWDVAMMFPMLEMSNFKHYCSQKILYIYNTHNSINDFKIDKKLQDDLADFIRCKKSYEKLNSPNKIYKQKELIDVIILGDNKTQLKKCIDNLLINISIINKVYVFNDKIENENLHLNNVDVINLAELDNYLIKNPTNYILLLHENDIEFNKSININEIIFYLRRTAVNKFSLFKQNHSFLKIFYEKINVFKYNIKIFEELFDCSIYNKQNLIEILKDLNNSKIIEKNYLSISLNT